MPVIIFGDPKHVWSAIGDPRYAQRSCIVLHGPHLAVGAIQTVRALPNQWPSSVPVCVTVPDLAKRPPTRCYCDRITRPIRTLCLPISPPDLGTPFSLMSSPFPYRKVQSIKGVKACKKRSMAS